MKSSDGFLIRIGELKDIDELVKFNIALASETEGLMLSEKILRKGVENLIENKDYGFYLIAENNGTIVGSLMVTTEWSDWRNGFFWWVQSVYVKPENRRQGIYSSLYKHAKKLSERKMNVLGFRLYVEKNNSIAIETYKALGMIETHYKLFEEINQ